jgi:predicted nuclease with TOPRIM domain
MTDQVFQTQVLNELSKLNGRFDSLEGKFDSLEWKVDSLDWRLVHVEWKVDSLNGKVDSLEGKVDSLEWKVDSLSIDFRDFKENQERFNNAIWNLNTQAFQSINEIRGEIVAPWKMKKSV